MVETNQVVVERVEKEIPYRGKGYLILRQCPPEELEAVLDREAAALFSLGAKQVYVSSGDSDAAFRGGMLGPWRLTFRHEMLDLFRELDESRPRPNGRLRLELLDQGREAEWLDCYNEGFFRVPNAQTYLPEDLEEVRAKGGLLGFALLRGRPVGVYELLPGGECPEISGIALRESVRGQGLGRELLLSTMDLLADLGKSRCRLLVSTGNIPALTLYRETGFGEDMVRGRWYEVMTHG